LGGSGLVLVEQAQGELGSTALGQRADTFERIVVRGVGDQRGVGVLVMVGVKVGFGVLVGVGLGVGLAPQPAVAISSASTARAMTGQKVGTCFLKTQLLA